MFIEPNYPFTAKITVNVAVAVYMAFSHHQCGSGVLLRSTTINVAVARLVAFNHHQCGSGCVRVVAF